MKSKLLLILLPIAVASCSLLNLNEPMKKIVKSIKTEKYYCYNDPESDGTKMDSSLVFFDINENPIVEYDGLGKLSKSIIIKNFDDSNRLVKTINKNYLGKVISTEEWEYNSDGKEVKHTKLNSDNEETFSQISKYNTDNQLIERSSFDKLDGIEAVENIYDFNGHLIQKNLRNESSSNDTEYSYEYDSNGNILKRSKTNPYAGFDLIETTSYYSNNEVKQNSLEWIKTEGSATVISDLDESGKLLKRTTLHGKKLHQESSYEYDAYENETYCYTYYTNGDTTATCRHKNIYDNSGNLLEIETYYDGDFSSRETFKYNELDSLVESSRYDAFNEIEEKKLIEYDSKDNMRRDVVSGNYSFRNHDWEFVYDNNSKLIRKNRFKENKLIIYDIYEYDASDNEI